MGVKQTSYDKTVFLALNSSVVLWSCYFFLLNIKVCGELNL